MKYVIIILLVVFTPLIHGKESISYTRGEVIKLIPRQRWEKADGKTVVIVWDGKEKVKVTIPTQYIRKIHHGRIFPFKITRDPKTGRFVSQGRKGI